MIYSAEKRPHFPNLTLFHLRQIFFVLPVLLYIFGVLLFPLLELFFGNHGSFDAIITKIKIKSFQSQLSRPSANQQLDLPPSMD